MKVIEGVDVRKVGKLRRSKILQRMERKDMAAIHGVCYGKSKRKLRLEIERRQARKAKAR